MSDSSADLAPDADARRSGARRLDETKPEAVYFSEFDGLGTAIVIVDAAAASRLSTFAEPWFLTFNANAEFHPAMTPEDLGRAGLDALGKKWA